MIGIYNNDICPYCGDGYLHWAGCSYECSNCKQYLTELEISQLVQEHDDYL